MKFSLNWFKSKKQEELQELKIEEQKLKNALLFKELHYEENETPSLPVAPNIPYKKVKLVNNVLTVLLHDGTILSKSNASADDYYTVKDAITEDEILGIMVVKEIREERIAKAKEYEKAKTLNKGLIILESTGDFVVDGNSVYLKGINRSLPQLLVERFLLIVNEYDGNFNYLQENVEYQSLKRFFMWCCLNPRAEVANELYRFLMDNSFRITKQGFFVALRNVVTLQQDNAIVKFVSNAYNKVKAVWKKNPDNYRVVEYNGGYSIEAVTNTSPRGTIVGNLTSLYLELPNMAENRFTDDWTRTFDIRIGKVVNMPTEDCNWSTQDCAAAGLHFTSDQIHYVGCGDQSVLVLINPMKVVGIGQHKGRCYEYLPIMAVPREEATEILHDLDFDTLELDEDYAIRELEDLQEKAQDGFAVEASKHEFNMPAISTIEVEKIVASLDEIKKDISKRIVTIS
jgi:hypothetical protein